MHGKLMAQISVLTLMAALISNRLTFAQGSAPDATALAKETQNPVAALITVPFQFNFNTGGDLEDALHRGCPAP